ncbi:hypothetical protein D3C85_531300 [compost metagenome]
MGITAPIGADLHANTGRCTLAPFPPRTFAMSAPSDPTRCPLCGQSNQCTQADPAHADQDCWCFAVPINPTALARIPPQEIDRSCLCPRCAQALPADAPS